MGWADNAGGFNKQFAGSISRHASLNTRSSIEIDVLSVNLIRAMLLYLLY